MEIVGFSNFFSKQQQQNISSSKTNMIAETLTYVCRSIGMMLMIGCFSVTYGWILCLCFVIFMIGLSGAGIGFENIFFLYSADQIFEEMTYILIIMVFAIGTSGASGWISFQMSQREKKKIL